MDTPCKRQFYCISAGFTGLGGGERGGKTIAAGL